MSAVATLSVGAWIAFDPRGNDEMEDALIGVIVSDDPKNGLMVLANGSSNRRYRLRDIAVLSLLREAPERAFRPGDQVTRNFDIGRERVFTVGDRYHWSGGFSVELIDADGEPAGMTSERFLSPAGFSVRVRA